MTGLAQSSSPGPVAAMPARRAPVISDHEMIRPIGEGGSGQVWLARTALGTYRAVKVVSQASFKHRRPFERGFTPVSARFRTRVSPL